MPVPARDVTQMTAAADLIVAGREARHAGEPGEAWRAKTFDIVPTRILKGQLAPRAFAAVNARVYEPVIDSPDEELSHQAIGEICFEINRCGDDASFRALEKPENHAKLRALIKAWQHG
jgi:hypothetical protein